jgi:hypothetical protein
MGIIKDLKTFYRSKWVNYILKATQHNLVTSPSTDEEVSTRIELLQAVQFILTVCGKSARSFRTALLTVVVNTQTLRCRMRPIVKMMSYWKSTPSEITKSFQAMTVVSGVWVT